MNAAWTGRAQAVDNGTQTQSDELIPQKHSERLYEANNNEQSSLTIISGALHNNLSQFKDYHDKLKLLVD